MSVLEFIPLAWAAVFVFFIYSSSRVEAVDLGCVEKDLLALKDFAGNLTAGEIVTSWSDNQRCCGWDGVRCNNGSRIVELILPDRGLEGGISSSLSHLDELRVLNLSRNRLKNRLPKEFSDLRKLEVLDLSHNMVSGSDGVLGFQKIRSMNLSSNLMKGSMFDLGQFPNLVEFNLSNNSFTGALDHSMCSSNGLRVLDLSMNDFNGNLDDLQNCSTSLRRLHLDENSFSGHLPEFIFAMSSLKQISISRNKFSGQISVNLGNLFLLETLIVSSNNFTGPLPNIFGNLTRLESLVATSNFFTGLLPSTLSFCSKLQVLDLRNNSLTGTIHLNFAALPRLSILDFGTNRFSGALPDSLSNCRNLKILGVARNYLVGQVPESYANLTKISFFSISNNGFVNLTRVLSVLQTYRNLTSVILTRNFNGEELSQTVIGSGIPTLRIFAIANCGLSGQIPIWLSHCRMLQVLDLSWNHLNGNIPPWIGKMENLFYLDLSNNSLTGAIPKSLADLKSLNSTTNSNFTDLTTIGVPLYVKRNQNANGLQYNQFSSFPPSILLSNNNISGAIWPEFGNLKQLHVLDLSKNNITGTIPSTISNMANLESLDLSSNRLRGSIPPSFRKLTFLSRFSVANNNIQGVIPSGPQFSSFPSSSFEGNPNLCYIDCDTPPSLTDIRSVSNKRFGRRSILAITLSAGIGIALLLGSVLWKKASRRDAEEDEDGIMNDGEDEPHQSSLAETNKLVLFQNSICMRNLTVADLLKSTNNFNQTNIIGCGGFGLVYKAVFPDNTRAAVKRLSGDCGQMEREFQAEVEALSRAQNKHLVSLQGYCRYGTDRLLIYSYMANGSLDYWLHERVEGEPFLKWEIRLKIARGAGHGLFYLHKLCNPNIVHRDIKSSNILLDESFEARLADFGLSRLLRPYDTHVTTDLVGTLGYIPPEYGQTLTATFKGDVYSYGVVLLEIVTGRRPVDVCKGKSCRDLVSWVFQMKGERKEEEIVDSAIWEKEKGGELLEVLGIACRCLTPDPKRRPSIDEVVLWLDAVGTTNS